MKVFKVEQTDRVTYTHNWWCDTCSEVSHRELIGEFTRDSVPEYPDETPEERICPTCNQMTQFSSTSTSTIWKRLDTGEILTERISKYPGACFEETLPYYDRESRKPRTGPDGRVLTVICPNGVPWTIDSRASNCTRKDDNLHRCWVRHGSPENGDLHVDKQGDTCNAGAGSIVAGDYHGFLHHGSFTSV